MPTLAPSRLSTECCWAAYQLHGRELVARRERGPDLEHGGIARGLHGVHAGVGHRALKELEDDDGVAERE